MGISERLPSLRMPPPRTRRYFVETEPSFTCGVKIKKRFTAETAKAIPAKERRIILPFLERNFPFLSLTKKKIKKSERRNQISLKEMMTGVNIRMTTAYVKKRIAKNKERAFKIFVFMKQV